MTNTPDLLSVLQEELIDPDSGWSIGSMGAIAEFHQSPGEALDVDEPDDLTRATSRGAIRLTLPDAVRPIAYEQLSPRAHRWSQGVALCLPIADAEIERTAVLTDLGSDRHAIRAADRAAQLFDMGLDQPQLQFCVRTRDPELAELLRSNCGRSIWDADNPAMAAILKAHPHRVALSRLGRVEVYQKIGGPDTGGVSPEGPHTHVLPKLLRTGRTHSANTPVPDGMVPCASLHPGNPVIDPLGKDRPFGTDRFEHFQRLLNAWGPSEYVGVKQAVWRALEAGKEPELFDPPTSRIGRTAVRNALRQTARISENMGDEHTLKAVGAWRALFDQHKPEEKTEPDAPGHEA